MNISKKALKPDKLTKIWTKRDCMARVVCPNRSIARKSLSAKRTVLIVIVVRQNANNLEFVQFCLTQPFSGANETELRGGKSLCDVIDGAFSSHEPTCAAYYVTIVPKLNQFFCRQTAFEIILTTQDGWGGGLVQ